MVNKIVLGDGSRAISFTIRASRVLMLAHGRDMADPAVVDAEVFRPTGLASVRGFMEARQAPLLGVTKKPVNRGDSDQELVDSRRQDSAIAAGLVRRAVTYRSRKRSTGGQRSGQR